MRQLLLLAALLALCASANCSTLLSSAFPPTTIQAAGCKAGHAGSASTFSLCAHQFYVQPHITGLLAQVIASAVDTGSCSGAVCTPSYSYTSTDAKYTQYTTGYAMATITFAAGVATATFTSTVAPFEDGVTIWVSGSPAGAYDGAHTLNGGGSTWSGNNLTQVTWNQGGGPANCASSCGNMLEACGGSIPGHTAALCHIEFVVQHMTGTGPNAGQPNFATTAYVESQAWANQACTLHLWVANALHPINDCLINAGHFYHATTVCATVGYCQSKGSAPSRNVSGGTNSDGTITWQDDGTTNALPLEAVTQTAGYPGIAGTPASGVFNINSGTCGGTCSVTQVASGEQMVFEWPYLYWIGLFNASVIQHYAGVAWVNQIDYLRMGFVGGGETFPYASSVIQANYGFNGTQMSNIYANEAIVSHTANSVAYVALGAAPPWQLMVSPNFYQGGCSSGASCPIMPNLIGAAAMTLTGYKSIGSQGLQAADLTGWAATNTPYVSNYFVVSAMTYWPPAVWLEQQTLKDSAGPGNSGCSGSQTSTGPLDVLLVFATQHHTNALEPYATDLLATYDSNYIAGTTYGSGCSPYPTGYDAALSNAANGIPSLTSSLLGQAGKLGTAGRQ